MMKAVILCQLLLSISDDLEKKPFSLNCGIGALYLMFQECGIDVDLARLDREFPESVKHEAVSARQLIEVAAKYGLKLKARRLRRSDGPWNVPAICCLQAPGFENHFVFAMPCAESRYIQIMNIYDIPRVIDADSAFNENGWDGLAIIPCQTWSGEMIAVAGVAIMGATVLVIVVSRFQVRMGLSRTD
jgi:hypothetical protein